MTESRLCRPSGHVTHLATQPWPHGEPFKTSNVQFLQSVPEEASFSAKACRHKCLRGEQATTGHVPVERCSSPATIPAGTPPRCSSPSKQRSLAGSSAPLGQAQRWREWARRTGWRGAAPRWDKPDKPSGGGNLPASRDSLHASFKGFASRPRLELYRPFGPGFTSALTPIHRALGATELMIRRKHS